MKNAKRMLGYYAQNGAKRLTPRQRRRMEHKAGRRAAQFARQLELADEALAAVQEFNATYPEFTEYASGETSGDFGPVPMPCGTCGAINDQPCLTASGRRAKAPHKNRE